MKITRAACLLLLSTAAYSPVVLAQTELVAKPAGAEVTKDGTVLRVTALTDNILRIRIAQDGKSAEDASWAVEAPVRAKSVKVATSANGFETASLRVDVDPDTLALTVMDKSGKVITQDAASPITLDGKSFTLRKKLLITEKINGMGDKTGDYNKRGGTYVDWTTDTWGYNDTTDPTYKSIPFFISSGGAGGSYGIFLDNSWRSFFDFGHKQSDLVQMGAPDGPIDYYIIAGPTTADVVRRYTDLTGKAPLPPKWALGFQQSRYSYMSDAEVREIAGRLRSDKIPTDVIWLDIDYQDRNRPFTTNKKTFPDMAKLATDMKAQGINLVAITDLHVARAPDQGYAPYDKGAAGNHFVRNGKGDTYVAPVWPGPSVFPDFTSKGARDYWGSLYKDFVDDGIAGFWNDMNEPAIFETLTKTMPEDNIHRIDSDDFAPRDATHAEVHNVYGMQNFRATFEGLQKLRPGERPFVMTRATYAGGQRYAVTWTGDNSSTWDHLKLSVHQLLNLGLSGFSYAGADVGGFTGGPSPDLLTRWTQIAAFTPVFRIHAADRTPRTEPWVDGPDHLAMRRKAIEGRYRLMPYIYALADNNNRTGDPIMRPVAYDYPNITQAYCDASMTFTLGKSILVAPAPKGESPQSYQVCLPAGGWYDYWTGTKPKEDVKGTPGVFDIIRETPSLDRLPVFVRAGTILPTQPLVQSMAETPSGPLTLHIYPGAGCSGSIYLDDGKTTDYEKGDFLRQGVTCSGDAAKMQIAFAKREGNFAPWWKEIEIVIHDSANIGTVKLGSKKVEAAHDADARTLRFTIADQPGIAKVNVATK